MNRKNGNFDFGARGWLLIFYCFLSFYIVTASKDILLNMCASQLAEQHGWNYTTMVSMNTYFGWLTILFVIFGGQLIKKVSAKRMAVSCGIVFAATLFALPHVSQFWMYAVLVALITIINILWLQQFNNTITANWFPQKRGVVMGITTIGLPLGSGTGPKLYATLHYNMGLSFSTVYVILGIVVLVAVLLGALFIRDYPEQCGCFPDNNQNMSTEKAQQMLAEGQKQAERSIWTVSRVLTTKEAWFVALSCGILQLYSNGFMGQMVPRLTAAGYESTEATNMMMIAAFAACFGSFLIGWLDQKVGPKRGTIVTHVCAIVACFLNIIPNTACVIISIIFIGLTLGGSANFLTSLTSKMWGRYGFSRAFKVVLPICQALGCSGLLIVSQLSARYGYNGCYVLIAGLGVIAVVLTALIKMNSIIEYECAAGDNTRSGELIQS